MKICTNYSLNNPQQSRPNFGRLHMPDTLEFAKVFYDNLALAVEKERPWMEKLADDAEIVVQIIKDIDGNPGLNGVTIDIFEATPNAVHSPKIAKGLIRYQPEYLGNVRLRPIDKKILTYKTEDPDTFARVILTTALKLKNIVKPKPKVTNIKPKATAPYHTFELSRT